MNLRKKVTNNELYTEYVKILNGVLQLSSREAEVFSFILQADPQFPGNINSKALRNILLKQLGISDANLSKYLRVLKNKGLIVRGLNRKWILNNNIRPDVKRGFIELNIVLETNKDEKEMEFHADKLESKYRKSG